MKAYRTSIIIPKGVSSIDYVGRGQNYKQPEMSSKWALLSMVLFVMGWGMVLYFF